jgi:hypothetical protein
VVDGILWSVHFENIVVFDDELIIIFDNKVYSRAENRLFSFGWNAKGQLGRFCESDPGFDTNIHLPFVLFIYINIEILLF